MVKQLLQGVLSAFAIVMLERYRGLSADLIRIEVARAYIRGVQVARGATLRLLQAKLLVAVMVFGAVLVHAGLFILLPWTLQSKAILGLVLGLIDLVLGGLALRHTMQEKSWMDESGATQLMNDALATTKARIGRRR